MSSLKANKLNQLGTEIRRLRKTKGILLRQVSSFLEVDTAIMSKLERGSRKFHREQVIKAAQFLGIEPDKLLILWLVDKIEIALDHDPLAVKALHLIIEKKHKEK